jgi:2-keto-4-pentenoate hydratase/2-oxohepta-3-ene-1,7-dioic acid hydratase in catechol pathway
MKFVSYRLADDTQSYGVLREGRVIPATTFWSNGPRSLLDLLAQGAQAMKEARTLSADFEAELELEELDLLAPIPRPPKLIGLAVNYAEHHREFDRGHDLPEKRHITPRPFLMPGTCVAAPGDVIQWPIFSREIDYECELAVIIGRSCKGVTAVEAPHYVAGYTIANDISARSTTFAAGREQRPKDDFFDWLHGKWADGFCPLGPCMVTPDEIGDVQDLAIGTRVNDEVRQDARTSQMIFSVAELVSFISHLMTLTPGDVIATGTPSGVGKATGKLLESGDVITCSIEGIGELTNTLGPAPSDFYAPCK